MCVQQMSESQFGPLLFPSSSDFIIYMKFQKEILRACLNFISFQQHIEEQKGIHNSEETALLSRAYWLKIQRR